MSFNEIDISKFNAGLYFLKIELKNGNQFLKRIIKK